MVITWTPQNPYNQYLEGLYGVGYAKRADARAARERAERERKEQPRIRRKAA